MNQIKIVKIISTKKLVINAGRDKDIKPGDEFEIIDKFGSEPIIDPDTKENLGSLDITKGYVTVSKVYPHMSIVEAPYKEINPFKEITRLSEINFKAAQGTQTIQSDLNVDPKEITGGLPAPSKEPIKIGDVVIKVN